MRTLKIILSRKAFDSSPANGRKPSPLLPDGKLVSLPIPEGNANPLAPRYQDLHAGGHNLGRLVEDLTNGRVTGRDHAHLDPDLDADYLPRRPAGWRPDFGQVAAAESHLRRQGVSAGDIFLFFGWFREVARRNGRYQYVPGRPDLHVLFGWLQIGQRVRLGEGEQPPPWAANHPHLYRPNFPQNNNSLYLATPRLTIAGRDTDRPGAGRFTHFSPELCLTAPGPLRSNWRLPAWFYPGEGRPAISYHGRRERWTLEGDHVRLRTVGRGQEFVLDCQAFPEALDWLAGLL